MNVLEVFPISYVKQKAKRPVLTHRMEVSCLPVFITTKFLRSAAMILSVITMNVMFLMFHAQVKVIVNAHGYHHLTLPFKPSVMITNGKRCIVPRAVIVMAIPVK